MKKILSLMLMLVMGMSAWAYTGTGTYDDPFVLTEDATVTFENNGNMALYYFTCKPAGSGTITISGSFYYNYVKVNGTQIASYTHPVSFDVVAGQEYSVEILTWDDNVAKFSFPEAGATVEPNGTFDNPYTLTTGTNSLHKGQYTDIWYKYEVSEPKKVNIAISGDYGYNWTDIYAYGPDGTTQLAGATSTDGISFNAKTAGTYYIKTHYVYYEGVVATITEEALPALYTVTIAPNDATLGSVEFYYNTKDGKDIESGTYIGIHSIPAEGCEFVNLTDKDGNVISTETYAGVVVKSNLELTANFKAKEPQTTDVTVTAAGYATWVAPFDIDVIPAGVEACAAKYNGSTVQLTPLTVLPEGTPVVLKGAGTFTFTEATREMTDDDYPEDNALQIAYESFQVSGDEYVLAQKNGVVGFYKATAGTTLAAGKCYMYIYNEAKSFVGFDEADGINAVNASENSEIIYNINGQRLSTMQKGINIVGGKAILVK